MAILEFPWDPADLGSDFFDIITRHWPHYQTITLEISMSWTATQAPSDTSSGSISGTITWNRQSAEDETSEQSLAANEFSMGIEFRPNPSSSPRIDSALFHRVSGMGSFTDLTGSWTETIGGVTTSGAITSLAVVDVTSGLGVFESGTDEWFAKLGDCYVDFSGVTFPITIPTLQTSFLDSLSGPPEGADIVFTSSATSTAGVGGWSGTCDNSLTLTLST